MKQFSEALQHYGIDPQYFTIHKVGFPKLDEVFNSKVEKSELLQMRNLSLSRKTLLYAPSWDEGLSLKIFGGQIIKRLVELTKTYNVIIRPHPILLTPKESKDYEFYTGGVDWLKLIMHYKNIENLYISTDLDSNNDLLSSDLLISDVSSITWDFLLIGKPVLLFTSDEYFLNFNPKFYREYGNTNLSVADLYENEIINGGRNYAVLFKNLEELDDKITESLDKLRMERIDVTSFKQKLLYHPGTASERLLEILSEFLFHPVENSYSRFD